MTWYARWVRDEKTGELKRVWNNVTPLKSGYDQAQAGYQHKGIVPDQAENAELIDQATNARIMKRLQRAEWDLLKLRARRLLKKLAGEWE